MKRLLRVVFSIKALCWSGGALAALVTLIVAFHAIENWRGHRTWTAYRTAAETRGVKLGLEALQTPPIPDEENFAAIPLFEEIFHAQETGQPVPDRLKVPTLRRQPSGSGKSKRTISDLAAWRDAFVQEKLIENTDEPPAVGVLRALEHFEPDLAQLRESSKRPRIRFPVQWERGFATTLPHLVTLDKAARALSARCSAHLALGDTTAAMADLRDGMRLRRAIEKEPALIAGLVRIAMLSTLEQSVWDGLAQDRWDAASLRELESEFGRLRIIEEFRRAIDTERAAMNVGLEQIIAKSDREKVALLGMPQSSWTTAGMVLSIGFPDGWFFQNQRLINELFDEKLARIDRKPPDWMETDISSTRLHEIARSPFQRYYQSVTMLVMPVLESVEARFLEAHTRTQQTQLACILTRFRHARGTYPESLSALVPEFIAALPTDIIDGAPLRYRRTGDNGYEMWSIGENRFDDRAVVDPKKAWNKQPDWVWRQ